MVRLESAPIMDRPGQSSKPLRKMDGETPKDAPGVNPRDAELFVRAIGGELTSANGFGLVFVRAIVETFC